MLVTFNVANIYELSNNKNATLQQREAIITNKTLFVGGIVFIIMEKKRNNFISFS